MICLASFASMTIYAEECEAKMHKKTQENMLNIKLIAPASKFADSFKMVRDAKSSLRDQGLNLIFRDDIFSDAELPFLAAKKSIIIEDLASSFASKDYQILWAARGGYGSANILHELALQNIDYSNKALIGFSDITALHIYLNQYHDIPTIHGPTLSNFIQDKLKFDIFKQILSGATMEYHLAKINDNDKASDVIESKILGGNLTVLTTLIGTEFAPNFTGKIILLEDVNEKSYQIHRHLMHMKNAKLFNGAAAIIFGEFTNSDKDAELVLKHFCASEVDIPCFMIENIGHVPNNRPIVLGHKATINHKTLLVTSPFHIMHD